MPVAVTVQNLTKNYGTFSAVKGIDFEIRTGEVFGLLGPNRAGKTTLIKVLLSLCRPTCGHAPFDRSSSSCAAATRIAIGARCGSRTCAACSTRTIRQFSPPSINRAISCCRCTLARSEC